MEGEEHFHHETYSNDIVRVLVFEYQYLFQKYDRIDNQLKDFNKIIKMNINVNNIEQINISKTWKDGDNHYTWIVKTLNDVNIKISIYDDNKDFDNTKINNSENPTSPKLGTNNKNNSKDILFTPINIKAFKKVNTI